MKYLLFILATIVLFSGFLILTSFEQRRRVRFLESGRLALDKRVGRVLFIFEHVDLAGFLRDSIKSIFDQVVHDIARTSLIVVRFVERTLTRIVRSFRARQAENDAAVQEAKQAVDSTTPSFAEAMKDFKTTLRDGRERGEKKEGE